MKKMKRRSVYSVMAFVVLLAAGACGDTPAEPEPDPVVSGSWKGSSLGITLSLVLAEGLGGAVSGSGNVSAPDLTVALTVRQGTHTYPNLSLVLGAVGYEEMNFSGKLVTETLITGTLNGSGFEDFDINLAKQ
ncbi:MAG: hypothetical protein ACE5GJ_14490 [Gemmatimonadota bacterium]